MPIPVYVFIGGDAGALAGIDAPVRAPAFRVAIGCLGQLHFLHSDSMLDIESLWRFTVLLPIRTASRIRGAKATRHLRRFDHETQTSPQARRPVQSFQPLNH